jgi:hypothetical protein
MSHGRGGVFLRDDHGVDADDFGHRWASAWGDCRPIGYELRGCLASRWVRFHSLPGSQRYAESEEKYTEILRRHAVVIADLLHEDGERDDADLLIVTASWSTGQHRTVREAEVAELTPEARFWTRILTDDSEPEEPVWTHLWVSVSKLPDPHLLALFRLVADDVAGGVIVTSPAMHWLYHPYDGGADVIAASGEQRDRLRRRYAEWLSAQPSGL